ncbi:MAG: glycosyltransferase [Microbacteriaceae bacterium]
MTLLIISPDYASHLFPLATLGTAWKEAGERVVVATGFATASIVESFGFERIHLQLGRGSNPGVIRAEDQPRGEDDALRGFFDATRQGMIETLDFQARARGADLLWEPVDTAKAVQAVIAKVQPDHVIVDHLAFSARLALTALGVPYADVVLGHPSALPVGDEVYGYPPAWPHAFKPTASELRGLRALCESVRDEFTSSWNDALIELDAAASVTDDAFAEHGEILLLNYPEELHPDARTALLGRHEFVGSAVRSEPADPEVAAWLAQSTEPFVYVSFGSFLSVRGDVLARVAEALISLGLRAAIATGSAHLEDLGELPAGWLVREFLPQVTLLTEASAAVTHGGNNSVTEAMTYGVPLVVLPFSTDQFAGAAAIDDAGFGESLAPNTATVAEIAQALARTLNLPSARKDALMALSSSLRAVPGKARAYAALVGGKRR